MQIEDTEALRNQLGDPSRAPWPLSALEMIHACFRKCLLFRQALWSQAEGHLGHGLDWWSSQASSSLCGLHSAGLVGVLSSLLTWACPVSPCKGHLSWAHSCPESTVSSRVLLVSGLLPILGAHLSLPGARLTVSSGSPFFLGTSDGHRSEH